MSRWCAERMGKIVASANGDFYACGRRYVVVQTHCSHTNGRIGVGSEVHDGQVVGSGVHDG